LGELYDFYLINFNSFYYLLLFLIIDFLYFVLQLTAGAGRLLLYSHNVAISNVTAQSKSVWDELFSIWQFVGATRFGGKALCHHLFLPFGQSNLDWDGAFSDLFAHLLVRGIVSFLQKRYPSLSLLFPLSPYLSLSPYLIFTCRVESVIEAR
jgi:hypothetical protein